MKCDEQNESEGEEKGSGFPVIMAEVTSNRICFLEWWEHHSIIRVLIKFVIGLLQLTNEVDHPVISLCAFPFCTYLKQDAHHLESYSSLW